MSNLEVSFVNRTISSANDRKFAPPPSNYGSRGVASGYDIFSHIDATEERLEPFLSAVINDLEKAKADLGERIEGTAVLYRAGVRPLEKIRRGLWILRDSIIAQTAGAIGGTAIGYLVPLLGMPAGGAVGIALGAVAALLVMRRAEAYRGMMEIASGTLHRLILKEPDWRGMKKYAIAPNRTSRIRSPVVETQPGKILSSADDFGSGLTSHIKSFPTRRHIVFFAGPGWAYRRFAGLTIAQAREGMEMANANTGEIPDLLLIASCSVGNFEALCELAGKARFAIVSEELLSPFTFPPLSSLLRSLPSGGTIREAAMRMMDRIQEKGRPRIVALVDLEQISRLTYSLDDLARLVLCDMRQNPGLAGQIKRVWKHSMRIPKGEINFGDLGLFLSGLSGLKFSLETKQMLGQAQDALKLAVPRIIKSPSHRDACGISFHAKVKRRRNAPASDDQYFERYEALHLGKWWPELMETLSEADQFRKVDSQCSKERQSR